jgi:BMFP domain-containing protein YqiC
VLVEWQNAVSIEQNNKVRELEQRVAALEALLQQLLDQPRPKRETLTLKKPVNGSNG